MRTGETERVNRDPEKENVMDGLLGITTVIISTGMGIGVAMSSLWLIVNVAMRQS